MRKVRARPRSSRSTCAEGTICTVLRGCVVSCSMCVRFLFCCDCSFFRLTVGGVEKTGASHGTGVRPRRRRRAEPHSPPPVCRALWVAVYLPLRSAQPQARARPRAHAQLAAQARRMALLLLRGWRRRRGRCRRAGGVPRAAAHLALQARRRNWSLRRAPGKG